jgi:hypothetical protein
LDEDRTYPPDPPLDALFIVVAELHRAGLFDSANLASMKRRLELSGHADLAERLTMIPLANAIDTPDNNREGLRLVDCDGGNAED